MADISLVDVSFSLTEQYVIEPILNLRAPNPSSESDPQRSWKVTILYFVRSEIVTRIIAVSLSIFALIDGIIHLVTFQDNFAKLKQFLEGRVSNSPRTDYTKLVIKDHIERTTWFFALTIVGSIAAVIWPDICKQFLYSPLPPSDSLRDAPRYIEQLVEAVKNGRERAPFEQVKQAWRNGSLQDKHWLTQAFSNDDNVHFRAVRSELASIAYQPLHDLQHQTQVQWLSGQEIDQRIRNVWERVDIAKQPLYFHATSEGALESILKTKKIKVQHGRALRGAFVSTQPEPRFGRCILAFNRNIERLSSLNHGFRVDQYTYWAGFSRDIPVAESTLSCVILHTTNDRDYQELETRCQQWAGRSIKVVSLRSALGYLNTIENLNLGIPVEWPSEYRMMLSHHRVPPHRRQPAAQPR